MISQHHIFTGLVLYSVIVLLHMQKHVLMPGRCHMDGLLLDNFQQLMVILYCDMPAINVCMEFLKTEAH